MKYQRPNLLSWLWALSLCSVLIIGPGCATTPRQQALQSLADVKKGVEIAVDTSAVLHANGKMPTAKWFEVRKLYDVDFVPNFQLAVDLANSDTAQPAPALIAEIAVKILARVAEYQAK